MKYLQQKVWELEAKMEKMNECETCNVSKLNEGGCDCQIVACANCGEEGEKYNHHLCDDGKLRCDDCCDDEPICEVCEKGIPYEDEKSSENLNKTGDIVCGACLEKWAEEDE